MDKTYTKEFLISELQRFVLENGRNPKTSDMQIKFGYPSYGAYTSQFGSWNNALLAAGLEINQVQTQSKLDGTEICNKCGRKANEISRFQHWLYKDNQRLCKRCYNNSNYINGNLDPKSEVGFGFIGQRVVAKVLGLELKYDCNCSKGFGSEYDLYDKKYKWINVKTATLNKDSAWQFLLIGKHKPDNYIMLGLSKDKSDILHVWITEPEDDLAFDDKKFQFKQKISITNSERGLKRASPWETDVKSFNDAYHSMSLENCSVLKSD